MVKMRNLSGGSEGVKGNIAINGFGRIGRMVCRIAVENPELTLVAINASYDPGTLAHLLKYDSIHGRFPGEVLAETGGLSINGKFVKLVAERDPSKLPWAELDIDVVIEATGTFANHEKASLHLKAGAKKVVITTAVKDADVTVVMGVNQNSFDPASHKIIAAASCTTNCLAPLAKVLHQQFTITSGLMTTVHSYTNDQRLLDNPHKDLRRSRAGGLSIIPTTTGAAKAVAQVLPELKGKLNGFALRVPTPDVSVVDLVARTEKPVTVGSVNAVLKAAAEGELKGIIGYSEEPLVSSDYIGDPNSSTVDAQLTMVGPDNLVKVIAWYDNEWGYSNRVVDLAAFLIRTSRAAMSMV